MLYYTLKVCSICIIHYFQHVMIEIIIPRHWECVLCNLYPLPINSHHTHCMCFLLYIYSHIPYTCSHVTDYFSRIQPIMVMTINMLAW